MKLKLDENLPKTLAESLRALGYDALTVYEENLQGRSDADVWQAVASEQRFLITQDVEFGDLRKYPVGTHAGIMLLRLHSPDREQVERIVLEIFQREPVAHWRGGLVIVSEHRLRLVLPNTEGQV
ncbi:MAG: DUF5615 family PIN-like protein [Fimbriimonadales bacterium]|nr:DUF5615 family PIN-like protein [Fimbriimonadales bacterium]